VLVAGGRWWRGGGGGGGGAWVGPSVRPSVGAGGTGGCVSCVSCGRATAPARRQEKRGGGLVVVARTKASVWTLTPYVRTSCSRSCSKRSFLLAPKTWGQRSRKRNGNKQNKTKQNKGLVGDGRDLGGGERGYEVGSGSRQHHRGGLSDTRRGARADDPSHAT
jgi:hypothetical protein